jgi:pyruvate dehydrogenase E1 component beta subunit
VVREGSDLTVIAIGTMLRPALAAAKQLEGQGISAEVIDPRTLVPLDEEAILRSVAKTGRAVVVDEGRDRASAASHIAAILADKAFGSLKAPVKRVTVPNVAMPYAPNAEARVFPNEEHITKAALSIVRAAA